MKVMFGRFLVAEATNFANDLQIAHLAIATPGRQGRDTATKICRIAVDRVIHRRIHPAIACTVKIIENGKRRRLIYRPAPQCGA